MKRLKIFISSVQNEFAEERWMLRNYISTDALLSSFFDVFIFEDMPAYDGSVQKVYLREVADCDIYVGLIGNQYGYEDAEGISPTEREYDEASRCHKSRLIFIKSIHEELRHPKEANFIRKVEQDIVRKTFIDTDSLRYAVYSALVRYLQDREYIHSKPFDATPVYEATLEDIDEDAVLSFLYAARRRRGFALSEGASVVDVLRHLGLMNRERLLNSAAILLFGKKPQQFFVPSEVKCVQFYGNEVARPAPSYQIFKGNVFQLATQATSFVMSRIDNWVGVRNVSGTAAVPTRTELPLEAVQEGIVNAICHRDYRSNASVQVMLFRDRLEVWNPGTLPQGVTVADLYQPHTSIPANPLIAETMYLNGYIEKIGTGTEDMIKRCTDYGLKEPSFQQGDIFKLTIWRAEEKGGVRILSNNDSINVGNGVNVSRNVSENVSNVSRNVSENVSNVSRNVSSIDNQIVLTILSTADRRPSSRKELLLAVNLTNQTYNIKRFIEPLISDELIRPVSHLVKNQKKPLLAITEKGILYMNQLKQELSKTEETPTAQQDN